MNKLLLLAFVAVIVPAQVGTKNSDPIQAGMIASAQLALEERKLELEEKRIYLAALERTTLSEEKAREVSKWILQHLRGYPQGRKAKNIEEDTRLIAETLFSLKVDRPAGR